MKPAWSLLYLILPTLDLYLILIESRNCSRYTPEVRYIYLPSLESSLSRPVLPLLDCRPPILVRVTPEGGGVCWKLLSEKADACTVVWKTVSPTASCACMTSAIHGDISMTSHMYIYARLKFVSLTTKDRGMYTSFRGNSDFQRRQGCALVGAEASCVDPSYVNLSRVETGSC